MTVDLTHLTTFRTAATAHQLYTINQRDDLYCLPSLLAGCSFVVLGSGSNVLFADDFSGCVVKNALSGIEILAEDNDSVTLRVAAGEIWHDYVLAMSQAGFYGLENLALIPGTVGAAPVQNIGAYGVEIADKIQAVEAFDLQAKDCVSVTHADCQFGYRDSAFKGDAYRKRYIIVSVTMQLSKQFSPVLSYRGLLDDDGAPQTAQALLQRVIAVRQSKLPDPTDLPNAGSFFKNPVIEREKFLQLQQRYADIPCFSVGEQHVKIPAAWLLETAGFKGKQTSSGAGVYEKHALILVNRGQAHGREIYALACDMISAVKQQFDLLIEPEVRIIGAPTTIGASENVQFA